jgi:hypothetical protein
MPFVWDCYPLASRQQQIRFSPSRVADKVDHRRREPQRFHPAFAKRPRACPPSELVQTFAETTVLIEPGPRPITPPETRPPAGSRIPWDHTTNRRGGVRTGVTFTACIRHADSDEIVECDNISRGGLCFQSRKRYPVDSSIEIAAPYSPGWHAIFVPATIRHVEQLPGGADPLPNGALFRYGEAYTNPQRARATTKAGMVFNAGTETL